MLADNSRQGFGTAAFSISFRKNGCRVQRYKIKATGVRFHIIFYKNLFICLLIHPAYTNFGNTLDTTAIINEEERITLQAFQDMHPTRQGMVLHLRVPTQPGVELRGYNRRQTAIYLFQRLFSLGFRRIY